jgi:hypothetical protein
LNLCQILSDKICWVKHRTLSLRRQVLHGQLLLNSPRVGRQQG